MTGPDEAGPPGGVEDEALPEHWHWIPAGTDLYFCGVCGVVSPVPTVCYVCALREELDKAANDHAALLNKHTEALRLLFELVKGMRTAMT